MIEQRQAFKENNKDLKNAMEKCWNEKSLAYKEDIQASVWAGVISNCFGSYTDLSHCTLNSFDTKSFSKVGRRLQTGNCQNNTKKKGSKSNAS